MCSTRIQVRYFGQKTIKLVIVNCMQFSQFWAASVLAQARVSTTNLLLASTLSFSSALSLHKQSEKYQVLITYSTLIFDCVAISFLKKWVEMDQDTSTPVRILRPSSRDENNVSFNRSWWNKIIWPIVQKIQLRFLVLEFSCFPLFAFFFC